ncbi:MAG: ChrR family anti-sigma-E factor [Paracoccaceae bacterium]
MTEISHHIPDAMIAAYAAGALPQPFALVVATHVSLCLECRAAYHGHLAVGGAILEEEDGIGLSDGVKDNVLARLDTADDPAPAYRRSGAYPAPVVEALKGKPPKWRSMGLGVRQCIVGAGPEGSVRLLYIPPGQSVPDHGHNGLELTLVLQGSFSDETGRFVAGDCEVADQALVHTPVADNGPPCICLAATDRPLRFNSLVPRMLQPLFRI